MYGGGSNNGGKKGYACLGGLKQIPLASSTTAGTRRFGCSSWSRTVVRLKNSRIAKETIRLWSSFRGRNHHGEDNTYSKSSRLSQYVGRDHRRDRPHQRRRRPRLTHSAGPARSFPSSDPPHALQNPPHHIPR